MTQESTKTKITENCTQRGSRGRVAYLLNLHAIVHLFVYHPQILLPHVCHSPPSQRHTTLHRAPPEENLPHKNHHRETLNSPQKTRSRSLLPAQLHRADVSRTRGITKTPRGFSGSQYRTTNPRSTKKYIEQPPRSPFFHTCIRVSFRASRNSDEMSSIVRRGKREVKRN